VLCRLQGILFKECFTALGKNMVNTKRFKRNSIALAVATSTFMSGYSSVPEYGTDALFLSLMAFSVATLIMVPFLPDYAVTKDSANISKGKSKINYALLILALLATFLFQAANLGIYAYIIGMGKNAGLDMPFISEALGVVAWIAIAGSVLVIIMSTRFGRVLPVVSAIVFTILGTWILHYSEMRDLYWIANVGVGIT
jgi:hypothetical protein